MTRVIMPKPGNTGPKLPKSIHVPPQSRYEIWYDSLLSACKINLSIEKFPCRSISMMLLTDPALASSHQIVLVCQTLCSGRNTPSTMLDNGASGPATQPQQFGSTKIPMSSVVETGLPAA